MTVCMKTLYFFAFTLIFCGTFFQVSAQKKSKPHYFKAGEIDFDMGIGIIPTYFKDKAQVVIPPMTIGLQYRVNPNFGVSTRLGHSIYLSNPEVNQNPSKEPKKTYKNQALFSSIRLSAHCVKLADWDIYGGFSFAYYRIKIEPTTGTFGPYEATYGIKPNSNKFSYHGFLGTRYVCCGRLSFFGEIGYGVSLLHLGIGYRIL